MKAGIGADVKAGVGAGVGADVRASVGRDGAGRATMRHYAPGYTLAGGLAAVVDIGGFHLLAPRMQGVLAAAAWSFVAAAIVNYLLSSVWVYQRDWRSWRRAAWFFVFACMGLSINAGMTWWLAQALPLHPTLAKAGGVAAAFGINFVVNTRWVFQRAGTRQASP